jgi:hypothetical protein
MQYRVPRLAAAVPIDGVWDKPELDRVPVITLKNHMGELPPHPPRTHVRIFYEEKCLGIIFRVVDRFVRAVVREFQGPVWGDSCVEFFFTPGENLDDGYFNIETSCGGTVLFKHQMERDVEVVPVDLSDARELHIAHTMPETVDPEVPGPLLWCLEYRVPFDMLRKYAPVSAPAPGVTWRGNFYKCGDFTSHPHYLTWAPVFRPQPDFHRKEFFGRLVFA